MNLSLPFAEWDAGLLPETVGDAGFGESGQAAHQDSEGARGDRIHPTAPASHDDAAFRLALAAEAAAFAPESLHPALWRASQLGGGRGTVTASGHPALDAELPGGGWPHGALTELLLPQPGIGELRLLAPALAAVSRGVQPLPPSAVVRPGGPSPGGAAPAADPGDARSVMLFDPPALPSAWALLQQGLAPRHWLVVRGRAAHPPRTPGTVGPLLPHADLLWALEHTLRSGHAGAVLAWLPQALRADALRRLQLAAQACAGPVFVFRASEAGSRPSPAPLRLQLQPAGVGGLAVRVLKRRGPPLAAPLRLDLPPVLTPRQQAQALARQAMAGAAAAAQHGLHAGASRGA